MDAEGEGRLAARVAGLLVPAHELGGDERGRIDRVDARLGSKLAPCSVNGLRDGTDKPVFARRPDDTEGRLNPARKGVGEEGVVRLRGYRLRLHASGESSPEAGVGRVAVRSGPAEGLADH